MAEEKLSEEEAAEDEKIAFLVPIARGILTILAESNTFLGEKSAESREESYKDINAKIMDLLTKEDICFADRHLIFQLVLQAYEGAKTVVLNSLDFAYNKSCEKLWEKDMLDVKLSDLDKVLKS